MVMTLLLLVFGLVFGVSMFSGFAGFADTGDDGPGDGAADEPFDMELVDEDEEENLEEVYEPLVETATDQQENAPKSNQGEQFIQMIMAQNQATQQMLNSMQQNFSEMTRVLDRLSRPGERPDAPSDELNMDSLYTHLNAEADPEVAKSVRQTMDPIIKGVVEHFKKREERILGKMNNSQRSAVQYQIQNEIAQALTTVNSRYEGAPIIQQSELIDYMNTHKGQNAMTAATMLEQERLRSFAKAGFVRKVTRPKAQQHNSLPRGRGAGIRTNQPLSQTNLGSFIDKYFDLSEL